MKTVETMATVAPDGTLTARVPPGIPPGPHRVVLVIQEQTVPEEGLAEIDLPVNHVGPWPEGLSLRREDMYGDWGR